MPFEDRAARTVEALRLMRQIWTQPRVTFEGRFWQVREAGGVRPHPVSSSRTSPSGSAGTATRRSGASWMSSTAGTRSGSVRPSGHDELASRVERLRELASKDRRDPAEIVIAFKAPFAFRDTPGRTARSSPAPPAQIVEDLQAYVAAGARHFVLDFSVPTPSQMMEAMERFAADVRPHVGGA